MKRIFFLLPLLAILTACSGDLNDLDRRGLKGKVRSISQHRFKAVFKNGTWVAGSPSVSGHVIINYDPEGFYVESIGLTEFGDTIGFTKCRRENGEMVEEVYHSTLDGSSSRTIFERVSDEQMNFELWKGERLNYEGANFYDSRGRIEKQVWVVNGEERFNYYVYEKDLTVENYQENASGIRTLTQRYEYKAFDEKGNWTIQWVYVAEEQIVPDFITTREYTYY